MFPNPKALGGVPPASHPRPPAPHPLTLGTVPLEMSLEEAEARKRYENECSREWRKAHAERVRELRRQSYQRTKEAAKRKREAAAARRERCLAALAKARER